MSSKSGNILVIDDDQDVLQAARLYLKKHFHLVTTEKNPENIPTHLNDGNYDIILLDMNFTRDVSSGREGFHWLGRILAVDPSAIVILITAYGDVEMAVRAIKAGATDFVLKPWQNEKLLATINAGLKLRHFRLEAADARKREKQLASDIDNRYHEIIGRSDSMKKMLTNVGKVAGTDANILILGESGTGKELVAREIHRQSSRADNVFIAVDMGAITESLFESELFGHVKGAFTDAREDRTGRFEVADKGTLFLDEIGNIPPNLQAKLLSAIQNRSIVRVGSNKPRAVDVRLISATNIDIYRMIDEDKFRQDLLYRINTVEIKLPPLRDRADDIPLLVEYFFEIYSRKYRKNIGRVERTAMKLLKTYDWPGNIRELKHAVERAVIMCESSVLGPEDFFIRKSGAKGDSLVLNTFDLDEVEREVIKKAMIKHDGNVSRAADELGLTRASLYRRIQKYEL